MAAEKALEYYSGQAKERQRAAGRFAGKDEDGAPVVKEIQLTAPVQEPEKTAFEQQAVSNAGAKFNVKQHGNIL